MNCETCRFLTGILCLVGNDMNADNCGDYDKKESPFYNVEKQHAIEIPTMTRVYIAGPYSDKLIYGLDNIRNGLRAATILMMKGYAVYCPWTDHMFQFMLRDNENLTIDQYYKASLAWLPVCNTMLVLPGWENSKGVKKEIELADAIGLPIFYDIRFLEVAFPCGTR